MVIWTNRRRLWAVFPAPGLVELGPLKDVGSSGGVKSVLVRMAGHDAGTQHQFAGFQKYFNAYTITGRRNYVLATYAGIASILLYFKLKPKKKTLPAITEQK